jgi:hypothetical protein
MAAEVLLDLEAGIAGAMHNSEIISIAAAPLGARARDGIVVIRCP